MARQALADRIVTDSDRVAAPARANGFPFVSLDAFAFAFAAPCDAAWLVAAP